MMTAMIPETMPTIEWAQAVARRAADPPEGMAPADVIDAAMDEAGVLGTYTTNPEYRRLWNRIAGLTCDILREREATEQPPAREWRRFDAPLWELAYTAIVAAGRPLRVPEILDRLREDGIDVRPATLGRAIRRRVDLIVRVGRGRYGIGGAHEAAADRPPRPTGRNHLTRRHRC